MINLLVDSFESGRLGPSVFLLFAVSARTVLLLEDETAKTRHRHLASRTYLKELIILQKREH